MNKRTRNIILAVVGLQFVLILGLLALPTVVGAIPGRYRVALQERYPAVGNVVEAVVDQVVNESELLPAAQAQDSSNQVDISSLLASTSAETDPIAAADPALSEPDATAMAATATAPPSPTAELAEEAAITAEPTIAPSPTVPPTPTITPTPKPLPKQVLLEGMGYVRQTFNNCGPANLTQVLNWYGNDISQTDVAGFLKPNAEDRNVSAWEIADYVNNYIPGLQALARSNGDIDMVRKLVAAGYPVVVEKGYELPDTGWWGHYVTVFGYDDEAELFNIQDTYLGPYDGSGTTLGYDEVDEFWKQFNYSFYVVFEPEQEAEVAAIMGPDMFDDLAMWQNSAERAEATVKANPEDAIAWFNLGTALTRIGGLTGDQQYYLGGAQAYDTAREIGLPPRMLWYQFQPYLAYMKTERYQDMLDLANTTLETQGGRNVEETYLYLGHANAFLGNVTAAREAYQEALALNQNFYPAQIALDALDATFSG